MALNFIKKGVAYSFLIGLTISLVTLMIMFSFIFLMYDDYSYSSSVSECSLFMNNVNGKRAYFGEDLSTITPVFVHNVASLCPSKKVNINKNDIDGALSLANDCYKKFGKGYDFLGANVNNANLCIYCGKITANADIANFAYDFSEKSNNQIYDFYTVNSNSNNMNSFYLSFENLPLELKRGNEVYVFYTIFRDSSQQSFSSKVSSFISKNFAKISTVTSFVNYHIAETDLETFSGIILAKDLEYDKDDMQVKSFNTIKDCDLIVPEYEY